MHVFTIINLSKCYHNIKIPEFPLKLLKPDGFMETFVISCAITDVLMKEIFGILEKKIQIKTRLQMEFVKGKWKNSSTKSHMIQSYMTFRYKITCKVNFTQVK